MANWPHQIMVNSIVEQFVGKQNPFSTPVFKAECQEDVSPSHTAEYQGIVRRISAASVKGIYKDYKLL